MSKYSNLFNYFRGCPYLSNLMIIAGNAEKNNNIILPQGASPAVRYQEELDNLGNYSCTISPYLSVYEDYQINCYRDYDVKDNNPPIYNENVLTYDDVCSVCDWVKEQNDKNIFPDIGEKIISIECNPFVPQIRYIDIDTNTVGYFITVRIRYINKQQEKFVEYDL